MLPSIQLVLVSFPSHPRMVIFRETMLFDCRCGCLPWTWLARIVKFIGIWTLNPRKTSGGQPMAFGGFGTWLGGYFESWILILDPSVLTPEMPVAATPLVFGLSGNPAPPKVINLRSSSKLASVPWSTRWVMYQGFAAELHWSYLFLVNLAPLFHFGPLCGHKELCNAMPWCWMLLIRTKLKKSW